MAEGNQLQLQAAAETLRAQAAPARTSPRPPAPPPREPEPRDGVRVELSPRARAVVRAARAIPRPPTAVRAEPQEPRLEQIVRLRARAAAVPERAARAEDRDFAAAVAQDAAVRAQAVVKALEQRALTVTVGPRGGLRAPGSVQATILDVAR